MTSAFMRELDPSVSCGVKSISPVFLLVQIQEGGGVIGKDFPHFSFNNCRHIIESLPTRVSVIRE